MSINELANYDVIMRRLMFEKKQNLMESYIFSEAIQLTQDDRDDLIDLSNDSVLQLRLFGANELYGLLLLLRNDWSSVGKINPEFNNKEGWSFKVTYKDNGLYFVVPNSEDNSWRIMKEIGGFAKIVSELADNIYFWARKFPVDEWLANFKQLACMSESTIEFDFKDKTLLNIFLVEISQTAVKATRHKIDETKIAYTAPGYVLLIIIDIIKRSCDRYGIEMPFDKINLK